jgi:hypothetical protein
MRPEYEILIDDILRTDNLKLLTLESISWMHRSSRGHLFFVDALHYLFLLSLAFLLDFVCTAQSNFIAISSTSVRDIFITYHLQLQSSYVFSNQWSRHYVPRLHYLPHSLSSFHFHFHYITTSWLPCILQNGPQQRDISSLGRNTILVPINLRETAMAPRAFRQRRHCGIRPRPCRP